MKIRIYFSLLLLIIIASCKKNETDSVILYQDNFSIDEKTWPVDSTDYRVKYYYQGHYIMRVDSINYLAYSLAPYSLNFSYAEQVDATIQLENSDKLGNIGFVFNHIDNSNYSVIEICNNGTYRIWTKNNGIDSTIVSSTFNSAINTGNGIKNTIKIIQGSSSLELQINNNSIGSFSIPLPKSTYFTVGISTGTGVPITYFTTVKGLFNNFILSKI